MGFASREVVEGEKENRKNINTVREVVEEVTSGKESSLREENGGNERVGRDTSSYIVISIVPKEKGGGLTEKRNGNIMEGGSKLGVLSELDQNIEGQRGMCRKKKSGLWMRRAKMQQMSEVKENEMANEHCKKGMGSKRVFMLRDEEDMRRRMIRMGKRPK